MYIYHVYMYIHIYTYIHCTISGFSVWGFGLRVYDCGFGGWGSGTRGVDQSGAIAQSGVRSDE